VTHQVPALLEDAENALLPLTRHLSAELKVEHDQFVSRIEALETQLKQWRHHNPVSQQLAGIPGIEIITAKALAATAGEVNNFKNGSQAGFVPGLGAAPGLLGR
jgi:transposase